MGPEVVGGQELLGGSVPCQRWKHGRDRLLPVSAEHTFDRSIYSVDVIEEAPAKAFVTTHHYSGSYPAAVLRVGLFGRAAELLGVAVFSTPMNQQVIPAHCGVAAHMGAELGRFIILDCDQAPRNSESFFLSKALQLLKVYKPHMKGVVSYCDPVPRIAADGTVRLRGHVGVSYQACNARYVGRGAARTLHLLQDGTVLSPRTLSKIRLREAGCESAEATLHRLGARKREFGESPAEWLRDFLSSDLVRKLKHPGNHVYTFPLGRGKERRLLEQAHAPGKGYPKEIDAVPLAA